MLAYYNKEGYGVKQWRRYIF